MCHDWLGPSGHFLLSDKKGSDLPVTYYAIFAVGVNSRKVGWRFCDGFVEIVTLFQKKNYMVFTALFQNFSQASKPFFPDYTLP